MAKAHYASTAAFTEVEDFASLPKITETDDHSHCGNLLGTTANNFKNTNKQTTEARRQANQSESHCPRGQVTTDIARSLDYPIIDPPTKRATASRDFAINIPIQARASLSRKSSFCNSGYNASNTLEHQGKRFSDVRTKGQMNHTRSDMNDPLDVADHKIFRIPQRSSTFNPLRSAVAVLTPLKSTKGYDKDPEENKLQRYLARLRFHSNPSNPLEARLKTSAEKSEYASRLFMSRIRLEELVTQASVDRELRRCTKFPSNLIQAWKPSPRIEADQPKYTQFRLARRSTTFVSTQKKESSRLYRTIFAVLTYIGRPNSISLFVEKGICDADLPLMNLEMVGASAADFKFQSRWNIHRPRHPKGWGAAMLHDFIENQWTFLPIHFEPPTAENPVPHQDFQENEVLPFVKWSKVGHAGGHGQVYRAQVCDGHHQFDEDLAPGGVVAVKELLPKNKTPQQKKHDFEKESNVLKNISSANHTHEHLITMLATFQHCDRYFLIFPYAEADLQHYWRDIKANPDANDPTTVSWVIEQCQGIVEGLKNIHHYSTLSGSTMLHLGQHRLRTLPKSINNSESIILLGRHGDIKPENILWFPSQSPGQSHGTLKITDFGIAQFSPENKKQRREEGRVPNSVTYRSPECDLDNEEISSQCDIWALGCLYLVFVVWLFGGWEDVDQFSEDRMAQDECWMNMETDSFFQISQDEYGVRKAVIKDVVVQMFGKLCSHPACNDGIRNLLNIVREKMLIIQKGAEDSTLLLPGEVRGRRSSTGHIAQDLQDIFSHELIQNP